MRCAMLHKMQSDWRTALLTGAPANDAHALHPDYVERLFVYQRNVMAGLTEVLADTFPVTQMLISEETFAGLARQFIRVSPPTAAVLAGYGAAFPAFIARHDLNEQVPYLAGVARLEWARVASFYADAAPVRTLADFAAAVSTDTRLHVQPSVQLWRDSYDGYAIWRAHQTPEPDLTTIDLTPGDYAALIYRADELVVTEPVAPVLADVLQGLIDTHDYAAAAADMDEALLPLLQSSLAAWFAKNLFAVDSHKKDVL